MGDVYKLVSSLGGDDYSLNLAMQIDDKFKKMEDDLQLLLVGKNYGK